MDAGDFDFWLGSWRCTWDTGEGTNTVSRVLGGAVIWERFEAGGSEPFSGMSWSVFDADVGWRQTWVDSNGSYWHFVGGLDGAGDRAFATPEPVDAEQMFKRMVFSDVSDDAFTWRWEASPDRVAWMPRWTIAYRRA